MINNKKFATLLTTLALLAVPAPAGANEARKVVLSVDEVTTVITTEATTVSEVLQENSISVAADDVISPPLDEPIEDNELIAILYTKTVEVKDGRAKPREVTGPMVTVEDVLEEAAVTLGSEDRVTPGLEERVEEGQSVVVTRIKFKTIVKREAIHASTVFKKTPKLYRGVKKEARAGKAGVKKLTFSRKIVNGERKYTRQVNIERLRNPVARIVLVGTTPRPVLSGIWRSLAQCESGLNPHIVSSNGLYHGLFQFAVSTWRAVGGKGVPSQASIAEQLKRAKILQARSGWGSLPHCSSVLGLR